MKNPVIVDASFEKPESSFPGRGRGSSRRGPGAGRRTRGMMAGSLPSDGGGFLNGDDDFDFTAPPARTPSASNRPLDVSLSPVSAPTEFALTHPTLPALDLTPVTLPSAAQPSEPSAQPRPSEPSAQEARPSGQQNERGGGKQQPGPMAQKSRPDAGGKQSAKQRQEQQQRQRLQQQRKAALDTEGAQQDVPAILDAQKRINHEMRFATVLGHLRWRTHELTYRSGGHEDPARAARGEESALNAADALPVPIYVEVPVGGDDPATARVIRVRAMNPNGPSGKGRRMALETGATLTS